MGVWYSSSREATTLGSIGPPRSGESKAANDAASALGLRDSGSNSDESCSSGVWMVALAPSWQLLKRKGHSRRATSTETHGQVCSSFVGCTISDGPAPILVSVFHRAFYDLLEIQHRPTFHRLRLRCYDRRKIDFDHYPMDPETTNPSWSTRKHSIACKDLLSLGLLMWWAWVDAENSCQHHFPLRWISSDAFVAVSMIVLMFHYSCHCYWRHALRLHHRWRDCVQVVVVDGLPL